MPGCPSEATILALVEGELASAERAALEAHLASCEECRVLVSALARSSTPEPGLATTAPASSDPLLPRLAKGSPGPVREGEVLADKYVVERVLGMGGMGVVVAATHRELAQRVALKFLLPAAFEAPGSRTRFLREARAAARIQSEHVARVTDVGTLDTGAPYLVMEYLDGVDLGAKLREGGPLSAANAIDFVLQACEAIAEAHSLGIVHRDLKPANLFLTKRADGSPLVKVLDFGISKAEGGSQGTLTTQSSLMGSPRYMSPEQLKSARDVDARTDVWSLGVILYELTTGQGPFRGESMVTICTAIATDTPAPLRSVRPELPEALERAVSACLEKTPEKRLQSVGALARMLEPIASTEAKASIERIVRLTGAPPSMPPPAATTTTTGRKFVPAGLVVAAAATIALAVWIGRVRSDAVATSTPTPTSTATSTSTSTPTPTPTATSTATPTPTVTAIEPVTETPAPLAAAKPKRRADVREPVTADAGPAPEPGSKSPIGQSGLLDRK